MKLRPGRATTILASYSEWTALSALRSGAPIKSRRDIYGLLAGLSFAEVLDASRGPITVAAFEAWHRSRLHGVVAAHPKMDRQYGWAAKIINVYLKTYCYVGDRGRKGIRDCLHPPIDAGLWKAIKRRFKSDDKILADTHSVTTIAAIDSYDKYAKITKGLRVVAEKLGCSLIEVEQLWEKA